MIIRDGVVPQTKPPWNDGKGTCCSSVLPKAWNLSRNGAAAGNERCVQILRDKNHELYLRDIRVLTTLHEPV
jgi:hypothetical protein